MFKVCSDLFTSKCTREAHTRTLCTALSFATESRWYNIVFARRREPHPLPFIPPFLALPLPP